ncbi:MAG: CoA-binding protein [Thermoanaerobaculia bacterium]
MNDPEEIRSILKSARTIAVVGASTNPFRASHSISRYLMESGYEVIPINPRYPEVLGRRCYASLRDVPPETEIDIVDVFRNSAAVAALVEPAIARRARFFWMQEGVIDAESARRLEAAGVGVAMDRCIMKDRVRQFR